MARLNETRIGALLTEPFGATFSRTAAASAHAEHGTTVVIGIDADIAVNVAGRVVRGRCVIVPPDVTYAASCAGPVTSYVYDPELCPAIAAVARAGGARVLDGAHGARVAGAVIANRVSLAQPDVLAGAGGEVGAQVAHGGRHATALDARLDGGAPLGASGERVDRRVRHLVEELRDPTAAGGATYEHTRAAVARTRLSPAHLRALFLRDVGIAMRTYVLWRRLLHGLGHVGPVDLTTAAHAAGFADLAHLSRTCRRMLGYSPVQLRANLAV